MDQRLSLVTLGVADVDRAREFYEALGWNTGAEPGDGRSKAFRAMGYFPVEPATPPEWAPPLEHVRAMLARQVAELLAHDPGTRLGGDPEELHQARVATRRLRAVLRAAEPLLDPDWTQALRTELSWLAEALGPVRDLDVLLERLRGVRRDGRPLLGIARPALRRSQPRLECLHPRLAFALRALQVLLQGIDLLDRLLLDRLRRRELGSADSLVRVGRRHRLG